MLIHKESLYNLSERSPPVLLLLEPLFIMGALKNLIIKRNSLDFSKFKTCAML